MGARYAPSVANLFLNMWEKEYVYTRHIPQILIIMWAGTSDSFERFLGDLNAKKYRITLTGKWDYQKVDYLDLEIFKVEDTLCTQNFFL